MSGAFNRENSFDLKMKMSFFDLTSAWRCWTVIWVNKTGNPAQYPVFRPGWYFGFICNCSDLYCKQAINEMKFSNLPIIWSNSFAPLVKTLGAIWSTSIIRINFSSLMWFKRIVTVSLYTKAIVFSVSLWITDICSPSSDIKSLSGSIRSPGLPKSLSGNLECRWNLNFAAGYNTLVEFFLCSVVKK